MKRWPFIRDLILFFGGLLGVIHETVVSELDRPGLLVLFAAMMGLPAFLRQDERKARAQPADDDDDFYEPPPRPRRRRRPPPESDWPDPQYQDERYRDEV